MTAAVTRIVRFGMWAIVGTLALLGLVTASSAVVVLVVLAILAGGIGATAWARQGGAQPSVASVSAWSLGGAVGVLVLAGLVVTAGIGVLAAAPALVVLAVWLRRRADGRRPSSPVVADPAHVVALSALSKAELARRWRSSYAELVAARDPVTLGRLSGERRRLLDEIERRDPTGFGRWIGSGYWVRGDSAPFLGG